MFTKALAEEYGSCLHLCRYGKDEDRNLIRFFAEHDRSGFFLIHISPLFHFQKSFFPPTDLTDGRAPRFKKVSLETKYNIVVGT